MVLWIVEVQISEIRAEEVGRFTTEDEAKKVATHKKGWYNSPSEVKRKEIEVGNGNHDPYESAIDWAKENLSYNEMQKMGFLSD